MTLVRVRIFKFLYLETLTPIIDIKILAKYCTSLEFLDLTGCKVTVEKKTPSVSRKKDSNKKRDGEKKTRKEDKKDQKKKKENEGEDEKEKKKKKEEGELKKKKKEKRKEEETDGTKEAVDGLGELKSIDAPRKRQHRRSQSHRERKSSSSEGLSTSSKEKPLSKEAPAKIQSTGDKKSRKRRSHRPSHDDAAEFDIVRTMSKGCPNLKTFKFSLPSLLGLRESRPEIDLIYEP